MNARFHALASRAFLQAAATAACLLLASCGGGSGGGTSAAPVSNPVIVSVGASPTALTVGQPTTLTWSSSNATACQASGAWGGTVAVSGTRIVTPSAVGTFTYTLTCNGVAGSTSVVVAAAPAVPTVSLSFAPATVQAGTASTLSWSTTDATSCTASGAWAGNQATSGSVAITPAIAGTYTYNLSCTGTGGNASGSVALGVTDLTGNVAPVVIDSGPAGVGGIINVPFVSVTLCTPGTTTCQTIDHVLLDTGSYGLRIIAPGVLDPALALPAVTGPGGNPVGECAPFVSFVLWGSVHLADLKIAGEFAHALPVQLAADAAFAGAPSGCNATAATVAALGANGVLGVGLFDRDCGAPCTTQANNGSYYECTSTGCTGSVMPLASQVANPVAAFATDNNGIVLTMPAVPQGGASTLTGTLTFGIDTQNNNKLGSATVYAADGNGNFTTTYKNVQLNTSFLDSGSNGLFFSDSTIPQCSTASGFSGFYCPNAALPVSAVNTSANGAASGPVSITIVSPQALDPSIRAAAIGGNFGHGFRTTFDWGMPFFFGRTVFAAINGASTAHGTGPYWAY
jgi:hypothetical protein